MTPDQARKLKFGTKVYVARCMHGSPVAVLTRSFRSLKPSIGDGSTLYLDFGDCYVPSDRVHLTEEDAKADIRVILALRIENLKTELAKWF